MLPIAEKKLLRNSICTPNLLFLENISDAPTVAMTILKQIITSEHCEYFFAYEKNLQLDDIHAWNWKRAKRNGHECRIGAFGAQLVQLSIKHPRTHSKTMKNAPHLAHYTVACINHQLEDLLLRRTTKFAYTNFVVRRSPIIQRFLTPTFWAIWKLQHHIMGKQQSGNSAPTF